MSAKSEARSMLAYLEHQHVCTVRGCACQWFTPRVKSRLLTVIAEALGAQCDLLGAAVRLRDAIDREKAKGRP